MRAGAIAVNIPASEIPDDIPESAVAEYDDAAGSGWFVPGDEIPLGDGPTDVDPSDFRPAGAPQGADAGGSARASGGPVWIDPAVPAVPVVPLSTQSAARSDSAVAANEAAPSSPPVRRATAPPTESAAPKSMRPDAARPVTPRTDPGRAMPQFGEKQRYGEAVVREILGANFIEERPVAPRPSPGAGAGPGREG